MRRRYPPIERLDAALILPDGLARGYVTRGRPVVVRTSDEARRRDWDPAALRARFGDHPIDAEETDEVFVGTRAQRRMPLSAVVDAVLAGDASIRWKGLDLFAAVPGMREHAARSPPSPEALLPPATKSASSALWLAPRGTMSSLHHDGNSDNFNWQVYGRKLFLLVPPSDFDNVYAYGSAESPINPFTPELGRFPRFAKAGAVEATLEPGDVLLIPKYWWHCVYTVEASVNLNTWFAHPGELSPWRALAGAPLFYRGCSALVAEMKRRRLERLAKASRMIWYAAYSRLRTRPIPEARGELTSV